MKKRLFALFLCLCMVMTLLPVGAGRKSSKCNTKIMEHFGR